jgi:hypothetical protein
MKSLFISLLFFGCASASAQDLVFCQGQHTCLKDHRARFTCPVYGYFYDKEEAREFLSEESCCEEYINSVSIGFQIIGCGWDAPDNPSNKN